ncbi:MAG: DUF3142 domain-containing protein [Nitrospinota bacterium]|nr:DUF3142 domain-containing protein [Nitrospinota bacterium]
MKNRRLYYFFICLFIFFIYFIIIDKRSKSISVFQWYWANQEASIKRKICENIPFKCNPTNPHIHSSTLEKQGGIISHRIREKIVSLTSNNKKVVLTYRLERLSHKYYLADRILKDKQDLYKLGVELISVEIDFDSPTSKLSNYIEWLKDLKNLIPKIPLRTTGLTTWIEDDPRKSEELLRSVEEVTFQMYQGTKPIALSKKIIDFINSNKNAQMALYCLDKSLLSLIHQNMEERDAITIGFFTDKYCHNSPD